MSPTALRWLAKRFDKVQEKDSLSVTVLGPDVSRAIQMLTTGRKAVTVTNAEGPRRKFNVVLRGPSAQAWKNLCEPYC